MLLVTAEEMRRMDRLTIEDFGIPGQMLMENAGRGAVRSLLNAFPDQAGGRIGILAGKGNNGGDGFVMARYLCQKAAKVIVFLLTRKDRVEGDAAINLKRLEPLGVEIVEIEDAAAFPSHHARIRHLDLIVDAILGTGIQSEVKGFFRDVIDFANSTGVPVFAVDMPSGLNADTGGIMGACMHAQATATFGYAKIGHMVYPGAAYCGTVDIVDIGIPDPVEQQVNPRQYALTPDRMRRLLPTRSPDAHKGDAGHVLVLAGSIGKTGAASLAATSALRAGAGLVTWGIAAELNSVAECLVLEVMTAPIRGCSGGVLGISALDQIHQLLNGKTCLAIGPGIGTADDTRRLIIEIAGRCPIPMVIDADGVNCLAGAVNALKQRRAPVILTPHPGEMSRLTGLATPDIQADRVRLARDFAVEYNVHLVLKGARTVIAHPDGRVGINPTGNSGMASGGMGDVLTGVIAGLLAQGCAPDAAAELGVYLHAAAADALSIVKGGRGYLASEAMAMLPEQMTDLAKFKSAKAALTRTLNPQPALAAFD